MFCLKIGTHSISRMLILIPTLVFLISNPKSIFGQIWAKKVKSCLFCMKIGTHGISKMMIIIDINFLNFKSYIYFWANLGQKSKSCLFCRTMGTQSMARMLILIPILIFSNSNPKSIFVQIWAKKVKIITFMILFSSNRLHYCNLEHCVTYVVFMFCELVILLKKVKIVRFA